MSRHAFVLLTLWSMMVLVLQCKPIYDVDTFWQIRMGQLMLDSGRLVTRDQFTWGHAVQATPTVGWLAQLVFADLFRIGSWRALVAVHAMLFSGAFIIAGSSIRSGKAGLFSITSAVILGFAVGLSSGAVRPQGIALFCFAILLALARSEIRGGLKVLSSVPVLLVWQNAHPSVLIGGAVVAALAAAEWILAFQGRAEARPSGLTFLLPVIGACQFVTPAGLTILATSRVNLEIARDVLRVSEWRPPWEPAVIGAVLPFWLLLGFTLALMLWLGFHVDLRDLYLFVVTTLLALSASRLVLFWGLAMVPLWASWVERAKPARLYPWRADGRVRPRVYLPVLLVGVAVAFGIPTVLGFPSFSPEIPLKGIDRLKQALPAGRIYNYREWGGPLILANSPAWRVTIDGRLYLFPKDEWKDYTATALGNVTLRELVRRHQPDAFFLRRGFHDPLIESLRGSEQWRELYSDDVCVIFLRATGICRGR